MRQRLPHRPRTTHYTGNPGALTLIFYTRHTMHPTLHKASVWATIAVVPLLLSACANMADIPAGTPLSQVQAQFGAPNYSCTNREGKQRVIWTMQPNGQYAWGAN